MHKVLMVDEILVLARIATMAFDKPLKYMDDTDAEVIARFKKTITPELIEQMCLRILELEAKRQSANE
ncbi:hypothetical protein M0874_001582 [Salmonella enterica]|nr:hypothetical protein [Salmonella enterica]EAT3642724.1 hypothetical protein [Salmonella enterica]ECH0058659.1 hypothetical protein [Salmonella enterica]ECH4350605.1 hypothetical protein [Salmonella enterica]ECH7208235.1 hypothetical protein [Salmonella enterica]